MDDYWELIPILLFGLLIDAAKIFAGAGVIMWLATFTDYPLGYWTIFTYLLIAWVAFIAIGPLAKSD